MALFRLEDLLAPRNESSQVLDLSSVKARTPQEFEKLIARVPEFKIKPEKVNASDVSINDSDFSFSCCAKTLRRRRTGFQQTETLPSPNQWNTANFDTIYSNPVPVAMQNIRILDLASVQINWRMLTLARPSTKAEEEYFTKLVDLEKLRLRCRDLEQDDTYRTGRGNKPHSTAILPVAKKLTRTNKAGVVEIRLQSCVHCGIELCNKTECYKFTYDQSVRRLADPQETAENEKLAEPVADEDGNILKEDKEDIIKSMKARANKIKENKRTLASNRLLRNRTKITPA